MTLRSRFDGALEEWNRSVVQLNDAIKSFMNDGTQTAAGVWILTMNQTKSETLHTARHREEMARMVLNRIINDVSLVEGDEVPHVSVPAISGSRCSSH